MTKNDIVLAILLGVFSVLSFFGLIYMQSRTALEDGVAVVVYDSQEILRIDLFSREVLYLNNQYSVCSSMDEETEVSRCLVVDQNNQTFTVMGANGPVVMEVRNAAIRVIDEISPQNICQVQGWTNSPLKTLTCLPNNLIIRVEAPLDEDDDDIIIQ